MLWMHPTVSSVSLCNEIPLLSRGLEIGVWDSPGLREREKGTYTDSPIAAEEAMIPSLL